MKYDVKYPAEAANPQKELRNDALTPDAVFCGAGDGGPCWICGEKTHWIDPFLEAALCSEECSRAAESRYDNAIATCMSRAKVAAPVASPGLSKADTTQGYKGGKRRGGGRTRG